MKVKINDVEYEVVVFSTKTYMVNNPGEELHYEVEPIVIVKDKTTKRPLFFRVADIQVLDV